jgi:hypothetical protein
VKRKIFIASLGSYIVALSWLWASAILQPHCNAFLLSQAPATGACNIREMRNKLPMKLERKNHSLAPDANNVLAELERTMVASIALMKRLRRERRRSDRMAHSADQHSA